MKKSKMEIAATPYVAEMLFARANELFCDKEFEYAKKQYFDTIKYYDTLTNQYKKDGSPEYYPALISALLNQGKCMSRLGYFDRAIRNCEEVLMVDPNSPLAKESRAFNHAKAGRFQKAAQELVCLVMNDQTNAALINNLGHCLVALGKFDDAEGLIKEALKIAPNVAEIHDTYGYLKAEKGDHQGAIECCEIALGLKSDDVEALLLRGQCYAALNHPAAAIDDLVKAGKNMPLYDSRQRIVLKELTEAMAKAKSPSTKPSPQLALVSASCAASAHERGC